MSSPDRSEKKGIHLEEEVRGGSPLLVVLPSSHGGGIKITLFHEAKLVRVGGFSIRSGGEKGKSVDAAQYVLRGQAHRTPRIRGSDG